MAASMDTLAKLINLADKATSEGERENAMERAHAMAALLDVELAVARAHVIDKQKREQPVGRVAIYVNVSGSKPRHRVAMMDLWLAVSEVYDVECTIGHDNYISFAYGYPSDIELAKAMFATLSLQMIEAADRSIRNGDQQAVIDWGKNKLGVDARIYRRNFYEGWTKRVRARMWAAKQETIAEVDKANDNTGAAVAIRDKRRDVRDFYEEETKHISLRGVYKGADNSDTAVSDAAKRGAAYGSMANIGSNSRDLGPDNRRELSG